LVKIGKGTMLRITLRVTLVWLALASAQLASAVEPNAAISGAPSAKGSLVIIGGNLRPGNAPVWERILQLAGGKEARIAVFASAAGYPEKSGKFLVDRLNAYGAKAFFVPVAVKLAGSDYHAAADDPKLAELVRSASGAFFAGGDQSRITSALRHEDGSNTRVLDALWDMYRRGGVIAGTSAGAAIMSSTMFGSPRTVLATLKLGVEDYISRNSKAFATMGFFEKEAARTTETFGQIVHVFSTYESRHAPGDAKPFQRGINSIQLYHDGKRWWIVNVLWRAEDEHLPLPERYLRSH
jgi:hypothetical protein